MKPYFGYLLYFLLEPMLSSLFEIIPSFLESIEVFIGVYVVLMKLGDLTEKTVFQHFFSTARALFFMGYLLFLWVTAYSPQATKASA